MFNREFLYKTFIDYIGFTLLEIFNDNSFLFHVEYI